jgi:hypothetical protein
MLLFACDSPITTAVVNETTTATNQTRSKPTAGTKTLIFAATNDMSEEETGRLYYISRKWELGEEYIHMKGDGFFEASSDGKIIIGKWGMVYNTEDTQILKLIGTGDDEGYNKTLEIINLSLNRLEAIDENGKRVQFLASE